MNTRLQVEHTVTEMVTGLDLVALQLAVAHGRATSTDADPQPRGAAIQCRINAEDPGRNFLPGPGRITRYASRAGPFVRVDSGVGAAWRCPGDYDSMFAKLVVYGADREEARRRMLRALERVPRGGRAHHDPGAPVDPGVEGVPRLGTHTTTWLERALVEADLPAQVRPAARRPGDPKPARPADILVEVDGRRVPVRIFDERRDLAPKAPGAHDGAPRRARARRDRARRCRARS